MNKRGNIKVNCDFFYTFVHRITNRFSLTKYTSHDCYKCWEIICQFQIRSSKTILKIFKFSLSKSFLSSTIVQISNAPSKKYLLIYWSRSWNQFSGLCCTKSLHSCLTHCDPMASSPPGSSVYGILQKKILEWTTMPSFRGSSWPRDGTCISMCPALAGGFLTTYTTWEAPI